MGQNTNSTSKNNEQFGRIFRYRRKALMLCAALPAFAAAPSYAQESPLCRRSRSKRRKSA